MAIRVLDTAPQVGGTSWYRKTYPGARYDVESADYAIRHKRPTQISAGVRDSRYGFMTRYRPARTT